MKHVKFLWAVQLLIIAAFQVKATKDIEDYYQKAKRSADGRRTSTGGYYEKAKRDLSDEEEYEDDDDEDADHTDYSEAKAKQQVQKTGKALDEEREKKKLARDIDDYVR